MFRKLIRKAVTIMLIISAFSAGAKRNAEIASEQENYRPERMTAISEHEFISSDGIVFKLKHNSLVPGKRYWVLMDDGGTDTRVDDVLIDYDEYLLYSWIK